MKNPAATEVVDPEGERRRELCRLYSKYGERDLIDGPPDPLFVEKLRQETIASFEPIRKRGMPAWAGAADVKLHAHAIWQSLGRLLIAAYAGDAEAFTAVVDLASRTCREIRELSCIHQTAADDIARKRTSWPLLIDSHPAIRKIALRWIDILPMARSTAWRAPNRKRPYDPNTPVNRIVIDEVNVIGFEMWRENGASVDFPPLGATREELAACFEKIWERILRQGAPENNPRLRSLGISSANTKKDAYPPGSPSYEHNVHDGIRQRLRSAFFDYVFHSKE